VNPPDPDPQLEALTEPPEAPDEENKDIFFCVLIPAQFGQMGLSEACEKLMRFSNSCPQSGQTYSYNGIHNSCAIYTPWEYLELLYHQSLPGKKFKEIPLDIEQMFVYYKSTNDR
jgi:hypothetical protein